MRKLLLLALSVALLPLVPKSSSAAVSLKQNWQAGQQLVYDTHVDGNLSLQLPSNTPTVIAGIPLEVSVRGVGKVILDTLKVNDFGDGTVQAKLDPLSIQAETFGQRAILKVEKGAGTMTLNGAPQKNSFLDWNLLTNPPVTVTLSPQMKVTNFSLANKDVPAVPGNMLAIIQNLILQSLPAALPTKSLEVGDKWTSDVEFKTSPAPNATVIKLGSFQFELKKPQTMEGRSLQHITVQGDLDLSSEQSKTLKGNFGSADVNQLDTSNDAASGMSKVLTSMLSNSLFSFGQTVKGDLYFDAVAGQLVQADLNLDAQLQTLPDVGGPTTPDGFMSFSGTLGFKLSNVTKTPVTP